MPLSLEEKIQSNIQKTTDQIEELILQPAGIIRLSPNDRAVLGELVLLCVRNSLKSIAED